MRRSSLFRLPISFFIALCICIPLWAQVSPNKTTLATFEKDIEQGPTEEVESNLLSFVVKNPADVRGLELLARMRLRQDRLNEAWSLYQRALTIDPQFLRARIGLATVSYRLDRMDEARSLLVGISSGHLDPQVRLNLAQALILIGEFKRASDEIELLPINIRNGAALPLRAALSVRLRKKQNLTELLSMAKQVARRDQSTAIKFAGVLSEAAMHNEAIDLLRSIVIVAPTNVDALLLLARSEIYNGNFEDARKHLARAAVLSPESPDVTFLQGSLESEQGNAKQALALLEKSLQQSPGSIPVLTQTAIAAMRANQARRAVEIAKKLLEMKPDEPEFLYLYGASSLQSGALAVAQDSLERFMQKRPKDSRGCVALGLTLAAQSDKLEGARQQLNHCLDIDSNNIEAKYQLGLSYKTQGETKKAIENLEETVKLAPNYALALRDLGSLYVQTGAEAQARVVLEKSVAINPNDAETHFQLSRVYNLIGEAALARQHFEKFQKLRSASQDPNK